MPFIPKRAKTTNSKPGDEHEPIIISDDSPPYQPPEDESNYIDLESLPKEKFKSKTSYRVIQKVNLKNLSSESADFLNKAKVKVSPESKTLSDITGLKDSLMEYPESRVFLVGGNKGSKEEDIITFDKILRCKSGVLPYRAAITTYALDFDWLRKKLGNDLNLCICFNQNFKDGINPGAYQVDPKTVFVVPSRMISTYSSYHPKMMLLWYKNFVRLVIGSGNMTGFDWENIQNSVFVQDFKLLSEPDSKDVHVRKQLEDLLTKSEFPKQVIDTLKYVDFDSFKHKLVVSIPGHYPKASEDEYGYQSLKRGVDSIEKIKGLDIAELYYQCSSLGRLNGAWLNQFSSNFGSNCETKILFPTLQQVKDSVNGTEGAGTVILNYNAFHSKYFPKSVLHKSEFTVKGLLSHSKILFSKYKDSSNGWMYLGSHNFTKSAWGNFNNDVFTVLNYEIGVLLECNYLNNSIQIPSITDGKDSSYTAPLPFKLNWERYGGKESPWLLSL
ncbi:hypothetical protein BB560_005281 [Smittium megazygosporum]|uniref:PLD phosphodiesterase domain-containing protein n=1 Tax=Smittium megazygosporum TaxID=133381 RepID=A0A2T9Z6X4_9FUNG|nr:hypothetical protein BB560_005281 [Smittium megazygosporum]